jgi:uncharacterized membrane protein YczE
VQRLGGTEVGIGLKIVRWSVFLFGMLIFCLGIALTIRMQHLGIHPWDVLNVGLYQRAGLSIGSWAIIISFILIAVSFVLDKSYLRVGTFFNAVLVGVFVDFYLWVDFLPAAAHSSTDILLIVLGIVLMGIGGGIYNAAEVGAGPRDGFMLSIADKTGASISKVRIITESGVLIIGFLLGGPVFIITFIFTFIQSPIFQAVYLRCGELINRLDKRSREHKRKRSEIAK